MSRFHPPAVEGSKVGGWTAVDYAHPEIRDLAFRYVEEVCRNYDVDGVHFDFDKATLRPEAKAILDEAAALLAKHERVVVEVAGHTDSTGPEAYNQGLSERRANAVADYLSANADVPRSVFTTSGMGESQPVATNETAEGRQLNRRVEITIE